MVMDLEETEARNDCVGEGQQQFNPQPGRNWGNGLGARQSPASKDMSTEARDIVEIRYQAKTSEGYNRTSLSVSYNEKKIAEMSDSIIITCSYGL
jgi:hypothetical protein